MEDFGHPSLKVGDSCLDLQSQSEEGFFKESEGYDNGNDWKVKVKIVFRIKNSIPNDAIILDTEDTWGKIGNNVYSFETTQLASYQSKTITQEVEWDLKDVSDAGRRRRKLYVNFKGKIAVPGDDRNCYCK